MRICQQTKLWQCSAELQDCTTAISWSTYNRAFCALKIDLDSRFSIRLPRYASKCDFSQNDWFGRMRANDCLRKRVVATACVTLTYTNIYKGGHSPFHVTVKVHIFISREATVKPHMTYHLLCISITFGAVK